MVPSFSSASEKGYYVHLSARNVAALWIDHALRNGEPVPPPRPSPPGKMTLRLPPSLHQRVGEAAERDGVSINEWIVLRIADAL